MKNKQQLTAVLIAAAAVYLLCGSVQAQVPVTSGLRLWLEGDAGVQTSGSSVTNWLDQSGNGNHAVQTSLPSAPTYLTSGFGAANKPSVLFDGVNDLLDAGAGLNITGFGLSIFVLMKEAVSPVDGYLGNYGGAGTGYYLNENAGADRFQFLAGGVVINSGAGTASSTHNKPLILGAQQDAASMTLYTNGVQMATGPSSAITSSGLGFGIGNDDRGDGFWGGQIAEILVYDRALTSQERANVTAYFDGKYSLGIPEPSSIALLGLGSMILLWRRR